MLSIERLREVDPNLKGLTDEEVEKIRDECRIFAEIIFESWLDEIQKQNKPHLPSS